MLAGKSPSSFGSRPPERLTFVRLSGEKGIPVELADAIVSAFKTFEFGEMDVPPISLGYELQFRPE